MMKRKQKKKEGGAGGGKTYEEEEVWCGFCLVVGYLWDISVFSEVRGMGYRCESWFEIKPELELE